MTNSDQDSGSDQVVASLTMQADVLRLEIVQLQTKAALTRNQLNKARYELKSLKKKSISINGVRKYAGQGLAKRLDYGRRQRLLQLRDVNEQLVLAAMGAQTLVERIRHDLQEFTLHNQNDSVTNTPSKVIMLDRLTNAILMARRNNKHVAVLSVDLDHFKAINDTLRRSANDAVLVWVARRLKLAIREVDTVGRYGKGTFLILLTELMSPAVAGLIAHKILSELSVPNIIAEHLLYLSANIGIATYPHDGDSAEELIRKADKAMLHSKMGGRKGVLFYRSDLSDTLVPLAFELNSPEPAEALRSEHHLRINELREANTHLVMAALDAQEGQACAENAHGQQLRRMATVAHELRNPLSPISTSVELLNHARADEVLHNRLQEILKRQVTHLTRLVDDLIDGARITMGKLRLTCSAVDLIDILNASVETCRAAMDAKRHFFRLKLPAGPIMVNADSVRLIQVFNNLLENSIKYTRDGGDIALALVVGKQELRITVTDNGIGISPEALPYIFDLFEQDIDDSDLHHSGLGIGLSLVRDLVTAHGGTVTASSAGKHCGSEFLVVLPWPNIDAKAIELS